MTQVTEKIGNLGAVIRAEARAFGRDPDSIQLIAVSKGQPLQSILDALAAGQLDFGENFVQEAVEKIDAVHTFQPVWHFIGRLQANKTRIVADRFDWVHSIDRARIARRLGAQRPADRDPLNVLIQVDVSTEGRHAGVSPDALKSLADEIATIDGLRLRGLMCVPEPADQFEAQRIPFRRLRELLDALNEDGYELDTLSMGMSSDMRAAIAEGATMLRIGTAVFGPRLSRTAKRLS